MPRSLLTEARSWLTQIGRREHHSQTSYQMETYNIFWSRQQSAVAWHILLVDWRDRVVQLRCTSQSGPSDCHHSNSRSILDTSRPQAYVLYALTTLIRHQHSCTMTQQDKYGDTQEKQLMGQCREVTKP